MQVAEIGYHVQGDIGGVGISRFRFTRQDAGAIQGSDCNAVAAAARALLNAAQTYWPSVINWVCLGNVNVFDAATGLVQGPLVVTSLPATVTGGSSSNYAAGAGGRINWKTSTLSGRRLIKGATYLVPFGNIAFGSSGAVQPAAITTVNAACVTYLNALTTAALYPVIWHRPKKGTSSGGLTGIITSGTLSSVPAGLRSRRS